MNALQEFEKYGTMMAVKDGYIICPCCRFKTSQQIGLDTKAQRLRVWCRKCKRITVVDIDNGQCFLSQC